MSCLRTVAVSLQKTESLFRKRLLFRNFAKVSPKHERFSEFLQQFSCFINFFKFSNDAHVFSCISALKSHNKD